MSSSWHVKDELIGILEPPPVLKYWSIGPGNVYRASVVRNPGGRNDQEGGSRLAFPCGFVVDHRAAIFVVASHLALLRDVRAAFEREKTEVTLRRKRRKKERKKKKIARKDRVLWREKVPLENERKKEKHQLYMSRSSRRETKRITF